MASEVISHAIFASFRLFPPHPAPHRLTLRLLLRASLHISPCISPCTSLHIPPCTPLFTLLCAALHPPRASLHISPCTPTLHPIMRFTKHLDPHSHPYPSAKSLLPPVHPFPIRVSPFSVFLSQAPSPRTSPRIPSCPSPCAPTPFHTTHFHRTSLLPRIPLAKSLPLRHSIFLPSANFPSASLHPPCSSAKSRLWIFSCVKRPGSLTT